MNERLLNVVILIIVVVWALNVTVPILVKDYEPIPELNAGFLALVGIVVASKRGGNNGGNEADPPTPPPAPEPRRAVQNDDPIPPE